MRARPEFGIRRQDRLWQMVDRTFEARLEEIGREGPDWIEQWLAAAGPAHTQPTQSGRGQSQIVEIPGVCERLHLRRTLHGGWLAPLWNGKVAGTGRVQREVEVCAELWHRGAPVPRPLFAIGFKRSGFWCTGIATAYLENTCNGLEFLRESPGPERLLQEARAAGKAIRSFHRLGGRHADLNAANLLLLEEPEETRVYVIDLDKAQVGERGNEVDTRARRELRRLRRSLHRHGLLPQIDSQIRKAFVESYSATP